MIDRAQALAVAQEWLDAWNAHDPQKVVAHFADDVVVRSPVAGQLRPGSNGELRGKDSVLSYYRDGLAEVVRPSVLACRSLLRRRGRHDRLPQPARHARDGSADAERRRTRARSPRQLRRVSAQSRRPV